MENKVAAFAATPIRHTARSPPHPRPDTGRRHARSPKARIRWTCDWSSKRIKASGSYVYKTVNRRTGEVILQFPRDDVLKMREQLDYEAGDVIRTKA